MIAVYNFTLADGTPCGLGTQAEFDHWTAEGVLVDCRIGEQLGWEKPSLDERRKAAWAREKVAA